jgi:CoA:oxalate CoA-transferase
MPNQDSQRPIGPFSGLLIVDLSHVLAGPFCTMLFSDLGARVIKIERPKIGDDSRAFGPFLGGKSLYFSFINRGKESIALDLKNGADRALFEAILRKADVVVENFRPGTMDKLGFTFEKLLEINPRLIYASSSGFGQTGPMSKEPAYDTVVQGLSGLMSITGFPEGPATRVGTSIADLTAGLYSFCAVASALYAREKSGKGARVDVAMLDGMMTYLEHGIMEYVATGEVPGPLGNRHPSIAPFDTFQAADRPFVICAGDNELFARLCKAIGKAELASDQRFATNDDRTSNQAALKRALEATFKSKPSSYWIEQIEKAGVPCGAIHNVAEAVEHPQVKARNMIITAGGLRMPGNPLKISGFADPSTRPAAPDLDADGTRIRNEFGS